MPDAAKKAASASPSRPPLGFPRSARLLRRSQFQTVYRSGQRRGGRHFVIFWAPNGLGESRFGISIKRAAGNAVRRNRIRRRVREILRLHRREWAPGWDVVIHPRGSVAAAPFAELAAELRHLLARAVGSAANA